MFQGPYTDINLLCAGTYTVLPQWGIMCRRNILCTCVVVVMDGLRGSSLAVSAVALSVDNPGLCSRAEPFNSVTFLNKWQNLSQNTSNQTLNKQKHAERKMICILFYILKTLAIPKMHKWNWVFKIWQDRFVCWMTSDLVSEKTFKHGGH